MTRTPAVSVLVPVYNVERYLPECLEALCAQTLEDIEVIAVNDGSTDASLEILESYARKDARIRVIDKPNSGYGAAMNRALDEARGTYIGIVEPDDYPDRVMFQKLYRAAEKHGCDLVKCNYYEHFEDRESMKRAFDGYGYGVPFDPADKPDVICTIPSIWTGLYRRSMLAESRIRFRETPGASFQDTSFTLKAWFAASRVVLLRRALLHYRMDNPGSSVKSADKVRVVCDELAEAERFLRADPIRCGAFAPWFQVDKWHKYQWNYSRIDPALHLEFMRQVHDELSRAQSDGELVLSLFAENSRFQVALLLEEGPQRFVELYPGELPYDGQRDRVAAERASRSAGRAETVPDGPSPAVTVMVAAYDCERYIGKCLDSLMRQTYDDFEVIVVDDGSSDATVERARELVGSDLRFRLIEMGANRGPGAARNRALSEAAGEYVMYVDADDMLASDALAKLVGKARRQRLDELHFSARSFYDDGAVRQVLNEDFTGRAPYEGVATGRELFTFFSERGQYYSQGALRMVRRSLLEGEAIRFPEGIIHEDVIYGFRILTASQRSSFLNEPLYVRRQRSGSIMGSRRRSIENVRGHVESVMFIRRWVREHARQLDDRFLAACGREAGRWSQNAARDWEGALTPSERAAFAAELNGEDRYTVLFEILGVGDAAERAAAEWRESKTYRLGDAIATVPRTLRDSISFALGAKGRGCGENMGT